MNRLNRSTLDALASIASEVSQGFDELEALTTKYEEDALNLIAQIDERKAEAAEIMDGAANDAESYFDEKSEKWQEGERGEIYGEWRNRLREVADAIAEDIEAPEVQAPDRPDWIDNLADPDFVEPGF